MARPDIKNGFLDLKDLPQRLALSPELAKLSSGLRRIPCVEQVGMNISTPYAQVFAKTDRKVFLVMAAPSTYNAVTGQFLASIGELDMEVLDVIEKLPPEQKALHGEEDELATRLVMPAKTTTVLELLASLTAEITAAPVLS
jgi:hypothetical protein